MESIFKPVTDEEFEEYKKCMEKFVKQVRELKKQKPQHMLTPEQKREWWGEGEWVNEPEYYGFIHADLECLVIRFAIQDGPCHIFGGFLNGYVCVPKDHPEFGANVFDDLGYDVHGGLTYGEVPEWDKRFWIGFDCSHSHDVVPSSIQMRKAIKEDMKKGLRGLNIDLEKSPVFKETYRNFDYVVSQTKKLAEQVAQRWKNVN